MEFDELPGELPPDGLPVHQVIDQKANVTYRLILSLPMMLGNLLVLAVIASSRKLRQTPKHVIIANQSLCGIFTGFILMPLTVELFVEDRFLHHCNVYVMLEIGYSVITSVTSLLHVIQCVMWLTATVGSGTRRRRYAVTCFSIFVAWSMSILVLVSLHLHGLESDEGDAILGCRLELTPRYKRMVFVLSFLPQAVLLVLACLVVVARYVWEAKEAWEWWLNLQACCARLPLGCLCLEAMDAKDCDDRGSYSIEKAFRTWRAERASDRAHLDAEPKPVRDDAGLFGSGRRRAVPTAPRTCDEDVVIEVHECDADVISQASSCAKDLYTFQACETERDSMDSYCRSDALQKCTSPTVFQAKYGGADDVKSDKRCRAEDAVSTKHDEAFPCRRADRVDDVAKIRNLEVLSPASLEDAGSGVNRYYPSRLLRTLAFDDQAMDPDTCDTDSIAKLPLIDDSDEECQNAGFQRKGSRVEGEGRLDSDASPLPDRKVPVSSSRSASKQTELRNADDVTDSASLNACLETASASKTNASDIDDLDPDTSSLSSPRLSNRRHRKGKREEETLAFPADVVCGCALALACFLPFIVYSVEDWACEGSCRSLYVPQAVVLGLFNSYFALLPAVWLLCPLARLSLRRLSPQMNCGQGCNVIDGL